MLWGFISIFSTVSKTKQKSGRKMLFSKSPFLTLASLQVFPHLLNHLVTAGKRVLQQTNDWFDAIWQFLCSQLIQLRKDQEFLHSTRGFYSYINEFLFYCQLLNAKKYILSSTCIETWHISEHSNNLFNISKLQWMI